MAYCGNDDAKAERELWETHGIRKLECETCGCTFEAAGFAEECLPCFLDVPRDAFGDEKHAETDLAIEDATPTTITGG